MAGYTDWWRGSKPQTVQMDNISSTRKIESVIGVADTVDMSGILGRLATRGEASGSRATPASCLATGAGSWKCTC